MITMSTSRSYIDIGEYTTTFEKEKKTTTTKNITLNPYFDFLLYPENRPEIAKKMPDNPKKSA